MNATHQNILPNIIYTDANPINLIARIIALNCSAVLMGHKPASTVTFYNTDSYSGTITQWYKYKEAISQCSKLDYLEITRNSRYTVVLAYDRTKLDYTLSTQEISNFLEPLGYNPMSALNDKLFILKDKFRSSIPHEIGIFLGLPLKDVMGFMGLNNLKLSCTLGWKIYEDIEPSLSISRHYQQCRKKVSIMLDNGWMPLDILSQYPTKGTLL